MNASTGTLTRIAKLLPMLSSDSEGEVVATARAIGRALAAAGLDWHALAAHVAEPPRSNRALTLTPRPAWRPSAARRPDPFRSAQSESWRTLARRCAAIVNLTERERGFVTSMADMPTGWTPSAQQAAWLADIGKRLREAA